MVAVELRILRL